MRRHFYSANRLSLLWTPADDLGNISLWHDAGDDDAITIGSQGYLQIDDKSGNNKHITQITGSLQPLRSTQQNGLYVATFDGVDDYMDWTTTDITLPLDFCIVGVFQPITSSQRNNSIICMDGADNTFQIEQDGLRDDEWRGRYNGTNSGNPKFSTTDDTGSWLMYSMNHDSTSSVLQLYRNGVAAETGTYASPYYTNKTYEWGWNRGENRYANAHMAEWVYCACSLREKTEGYLAWRWGLQSLLPAGHPYELSAPKK